MAYDRVPRMVSGGIGESWSTLLRRLPIGLFRGDADGVLTDAEPKLLSILRISSICDPQPVRLYPLLVREQLAASWRFALERGEDLDDPAVRLRRPDGTELWVRACIRPLECGGFEGYLEDVTVEHELVIAARRQMEQELQSAQRLEAVGSLAGGVAHDFNNVLAVIGMASELMLDELASDDPARERLFEIREATEKATSLIQQLLAFSRRQIMWPKSIDLNTVATDVGRLLRRLIGEDIVFEVDLDPSLPPVKADPAQLEQVIMNLVVNAKDAMPDGGWLRIETNSVPEGATLRRRYPLLGSGTFVHLAVSDTGVGIDEGAMARIFEPFFTTKKGRKGTGTGLGLSTAYGIVKQSGGFLFAESKAGRGATFRVFLPQAEDPISRALPKPVPPVRLEGGGTILVVEDEEALRRMICRSLSERGYRVLEASDGLDALAVVDQVDGAVDLVLCDVVMPRMGAEEMAASLRGAGRRIPFLSMTGYRNDAVRGTSNSGRLDKPFSVTALLGAVQNALGGGAS